MGDKMIRGSKPKPGAFPIHAVSEMPPADKHTGRLVAVVDDNGDLMNLAFSDGKVWLMVGFSGALPIPDTAPASQASEQPEPAPDPDGESADDGEEEEASEK